MLLSKGFNFNTDGLQKTTFAATNKIGTPKLDACNRIGKQTPEQKHLTQPFSKDTHALKLIQAPAQRRKTNTGTIIQAYLLQNKHRNILVPASFPGYPCSRRREKLG
jgi:predicted kinase